MYCPKCGQLVPDNTRFCSRCGLLLSDLSEWLAGNSVLPLRKAGEPNKLSPRRKGMRFGAKMMFWGAVMLPIFMGFSIAADSPFPLFVSFIVFLAGLSILLYSRLFGDPTPSNQGQQAQEFRFGTEPIYLPPGSSPEVFSGGRREARTAEMARPSVTENTTKLLDREE